MKILYTANERHNVQLAANALRSLAQDVTVAWAGSLSDARLWVSENQDLTAVVVEAEVQNQSCASFVADLRGLGMTTPILVVGPEEGELPLAALNAGADDYVLKNQSLFPNLTAIVSRTLRRAQAKSEPLRLLYVGNAALARECVESAPSSIEITETVPDANGHFQPIPSDSVAAGKPLPFDVLLLEHDHPGVDAFAILKDIVARQLPVPVIFVVEWDEELAIPALKLGATDYVVKAKDAFRALFFRLDRGHHEHVQSMQSAPRTDPKETQDKQKAAADATTRERLEQQVRDGQAALRETERRLSALRAGNERLRENEAHLQATIEHERDSRETLGQNLANVELALQRAEQLRASVAASYDQAAQQASESQGRLAQAVLSHDTLVEQLNQATQALERAQQDRTAQATTAAEQLSRRESELDAANAEAAAIRESLERRLADAQMALQEAEQRVSAERAAWQEISKGQAELEARFNQELDQRNALVTKLAMAEAALHEAERRHTTEMTAAAERLTEQQTQHDDVLAQLTTNLQAVEQRLVDADAAVERADQARTLEATSYADQLAQHGEAFTTSLTQVVRSRDALEKQLNDAVLALERAQRDRAADADAAAERLTQCETELAKAADLRQKLEGRLSVALTFLQVRDADVEVTTERLTRRETELAEATETRHTLEQRLAEAESALHEAVRCSADERSAATQQAAQRQSEFEAVLADEVLKYDALDQGLMATQQKLAHADTMLHEAEVRHASAMTTAAAHLSEQQAQYEARLAEATAARDTVLQQLHEATATLESVRQDHLANATAAAEGLARREAELREVTTTREMLERRFAEAEMALQDAEQRAAASRLAAEQQAAQRQAEFVARLDQDAANREALEQALTAAEKKVAETESAIRDAEQHHASIMASAEAQFAKRQAELETQLTEVVSRHAALERAFADAREQHSSEMATSTGLFTERQSQYESRLTEAAAAHATLEQSLVDAQRRHSSEMKTAGEQFAGRQSEYETRLVQAAAVKDAIERRLREADAALERVGHEREAETIAAAERLTKREAELAKATANAETFERRLVEVTSALQTAQQLAVSDRLASAQQVTQRQKEFEGRLSQELESRRAVEQTLMATRQDVLHAEAALRDAEQRHTAEMTSAAARLSEQHTHYTTQLAQASAAHAALDRKLASAEEQHASAMEADATTLTEQRREYETRLDQAAAAREVVDQRLRNAEATLERIRQESDSNAIVAAERLTQRESELAVASAAGQALERRLVETETALKNGEERALADGTAATQQAAQRRAEFDAQLAREVEARSTLERDLAETRAAAEQARQELLNESAVLMAQMRQLEARLSEQLARERAEYEGTLSDLQLQLRALNVEGETLRQSLATSQEQLQGLSDTHEETKQNFERIRQIKEAEFQRLGHHYAAVRQTLDQVRAEAAQTLERVTNEHTAELATVNLLVAEREGQLKDQAARHTTSQQAAQQAFAKLESELRAALAARSQEVEQLRSECQAIRREFDATMSHRNALQIEADRVPQLTSQLDTSRAENRRQFEQSPMGILRCSCAGALQEANQALIAALGYRTVHELRSQDFAASVFESPSDLHWLIERCQRAPRESVDSIWKKKDGRRLIMRLHAVKVSADAVEIVAEDLTSLRAVEERLRRAQRMEAVGRLASEVAVTCDNLLRNVNQDGQQWLAMVAGNTAQRHQGELIFGEVTRAASFLRQLSVYGDKQTQALVPVDVNNVLRDLEPVLKRVAGDDIELVLPKKVSALNVDVDAERVERVLINMAAYGRARLPSGGRLIIELARVMVDRNFVTKYPNVRQGAHALIRVTEVKAAARADWPIGIREPDGGTASPATSEHPGVDLGALQALIRDCGGHLWMKAEPGGDMEVKIHLPLRQDPSRSAGVVRSGRGRSVGRWLQS